MFLDFCRTMNRVDPVRDSDNAHRIQSFSVGLRKLIVLLFLINKRFS